MTEEHLLKVVLQKIKKYLKWYTYPIIYFLVTSLFCFIAWHNRPINYRESIKVMFKTISVAPTIIWIGGITAWILIMILFAVFFCRLKKRYSSIVNLRISGEKKDSADKVPAVKDSKGGESGWRTIVNRFSYFLGIVLMFIGLTLGVWIARPYITLFLSTSKIEALEKKVQSLQVQGNRIIVPSILVDAPILEGVSKDQLSRGVCRVPNFPFPGQGGNFIIEGHNLAEFGIWKTQSFFSLLDIVSEGTPIYVFYKGKKYIYKVKEKTYRDVVDPKLYDMVPGERLTLITCASTWSPTIYVNRRTVVIAYPSL